MMIFDVMTLFPQICEAITGESIIKRAVNNGFLQINYHQIRDYSLDKHHRVDDSLYGGGYGMLMMAEPLAACFENICNQRENRPYLIYPSPRGKILNQNKIKELSKLKNIAFVCGHYEGIDQRFIDKFVDEEISIGDYVVTGGEIPSMIILDAISRMVDGVLSDSECYINESHFNGLLEPPQFTKPAVWRGMEVPEVLKNGNHALIKKWKHQQSLEITQKMRPDLFQKYKFTENESKLLKRS